MEVEFTERIKENATAYQDTFVYRLMIENKNIGIVQKVMTKEVHVNVFQRHFS